MSKHKTKRVKSVKKQKEYKKNTTRKIKINNNKNKLCLTKNAIQDICRTGQYTISGNLFNTENLKKLKEMPDFIRDPVKYKLFLIKKFTQMSHGKDVNYSTPQLKNDFYTFINKGWIESITQEKKKNYYVEIDNFRVVQEKVYYELIELMKTYLKENPTEKKSLAIKNVYSAVLNETPKNIREQNCLDILNAVEKRLESGNMYDLLAHANSNEVVSWGVPISWNMLPDEKNVKKYISHLGVGQLSLSDYLLYIEDDPSDNKSVKEFKKLAKSEYFKYIREIFTVCLGSSYKINPQDIWDIEVEMLDAMGCNGLKGVKEDPNYYNVLTTPELEKICEFDFTQFATKIGFKHVPKKVIVSQVNALKCISDLLKKNWNTPKWKSYWLYIYFRQMIRFESSTKNIYFNFHKKLLEGQEVTMPKDIYPVFMLSFTFNKFLSDLYTENNKNPLYANYVKSLLEDLKHIFIRKLERNKWLSPKTKAYAIRKMKKIEIIVGKPPKLNEDPLLNYKANNSWYNICLLAKWKHEKFVNLEGQDIIDIPTIDWNEMKINGTQNYMVNAYYRPTSNSIYVPGAYLQAPFIDLNQKGIEYNLAFIGYTIGHELSHSLDDNGSKYDEDGNLNNWWTDHDRKMFNDKIKDVIKQYEFFAKRDGIDFDASVGVGEDLADISGMALVEEYLLDFLKITGTIDEIKKLKLETFYTDIAIQGRQVIYKKAIKSQLKINPHPLEKYRANCPLSRLELFRTIFNTKKSDGMYWHNNDTIW